MKRMFTRKSILTLVAIVGLGLSSYAQTYHNVYLCDAGSAALHMPEEKDLKNGDKVHWYKDGVEVSGSPYTFSGENSTNYNVPTNLSTGLHNYTTAIESLGGCIGDKSSPFSVYKLPTKDIALSAPTVAAYCTDVTSPSSVITAKTTPTAALPDGIGYTYEWTIKKDGVIVTPITSLGSSNSSDTDVNTFTLTTADIGMYEFSAKVTYKILAPNDGVLRSGDGKGCEVATTTTQTVEVMPKPAKPRITLAN